MNTDEKNSLGPALSDCKQAAARSPLRQAPLPPLGWMMRATSEKAEDLRREIVAFAEGRSFGVVGGGDGKSYGTQPRGGYSPDVWLSA